MARDEGQLFIVNPYDDNHIALVQEFEEKVEYDLPRKVSDILLQIRDTMSQEEYEEKLQSGNESVFNLFLLQDGVLKDSCCVEVNRDTRSCELDFMSPSEATNKRTTERLLTLATDFAESNLGMENIELTMMNRGEDMKSYLGELGYTAVNTRYGMGEGSTSFVKTAGKVNESSRVR